MKYSISVFFPAYNDEGSIEKMVTTAILTLNQITKDYEVIVIDDCSPDNSGKIADKLSKKFKKVRVIHHKRNMGYGGSLKSGFKNAKKDLIFYTDGDGQYDVRELKKLLPLMEPNIDIVQGFKIKRSDQFHRKLFGWLYQYGIKFTFGLKIKDVDCDFRLIRKKLFDKIFLEHDTGVICLEMVKKMQNAGFKFAEVGVNHYFRMHGQSQFFNFKRVGRVFRDVARLWWKLVVLNKLKSD